MADMSSDDCHPKPWKLTLQTLSSSPAHLLENPPRPHDMAGIRALELAAEANENGTYGVGAVLLDGTGAIVCEGRNRVRSGGGFRSDLHAEMVLINNWEDANPGGSGMGRYTIISTLEPCPMCITRIIFSGIGTTRYLCSDSIGGMVQRKEGLPPIFLDLTEQQRQVWGEADCSPILASLAFQIWDDGRNKVDKVVVNRSLN